MKRDFRLFIRDILEAIENIDDFIVNMDFNEFNGDEKTRSAVVWKIGVIGEATKNIPKNIRDKHKELPWREMARMRDKISMTMRPSRSSFGLFLLLHPLQ